MSASYLVDLGNTTVMGLSLPSTGATAQLGASGQFVGASGVQIGASLDLLHANSFTNLLATGLCVQSSGAIVLQVQTADADVSGQYTDPTSGLAQLPTSFASGGLLWINSGATGGVLGAQTSGQSVLSGFAVSAGFQRLGRYARVNFLGGTGFVASSGSITDCLTATLIGQARTTGSGGGFSLSPASGAVSV